jgi:hypothetical protein
LFGAVVERAGVATLEERLLRRRNNGTLDDSEEDDDDNVTFVVVVVDNDGVFDDATDGMHTGAWEPDGTAKEEEEDKNVVAPHEVAFSNMAVRAKAISLKACPAFSCDFLSFNSTYRKIQVVPSSPPSAASVRGCDGGCCCCMNRPPFSCTNATTLLMTTDLSLRVGACTYRSNANATATRKRRLVVLLKAFLSRLHNTSNSPISSTNDRGGDDDLINFPQILLPRQMPFDDTLLLA